MVVAAVNGALGVSEPQRNGGCRRTAVFLHHVLQHHYTQPVGVVVPALRIDFLASLISLREVEKKKDKNTAKKPTWCNRIVLKPKSFVTCRSKANAASVGAVYSPSDHQLKLMRESRAGTKTRQKYTKMITKKKKIKHTKVLQKTRYARLIKPPRQKDEFAVDRRPHP